MIAIGTTQLLMPKRVAEVGEVDQFPSFWEFGELKIVNPQLCIYLPVE